MRRGRHTKLLEKAFLGSKEKIEAERVRYESAARDASVGMGSHKDDPLAAYCEYALFITDYYPAGSPHSVRAIEEPCRKYAKEERYRDDLRLLRLWILYIELRRDKLDVFNYMKRKRIGETWTLLYEAWAAALEAARKYPEAQEVYIMGVNLKATPLERLVQRESEFHSRMNGRNKRDESRKQQAEAKKLEDSYREASRKERNTIRAEPSLASAVLSHNTESKTHKKERKSELVRPALSSISEQEARTGLRPFSSHSAHASSSTVSQVASSSYPQLKQGTKTDGKFEIFTDTGRPLESTHSLSHSSPGHQFSFDALSKIEDVGKEDRGKLPSKWAGETLLQNQSTVDSLKTRGLAKPDSSFQIFQDDSRPGLQNSETCGSASHPSPHASHFQVGDDTENTPIHFSQVTRPPSISQKSEPEHRPPSPTINTKIAMREVDDMFNSTIGQAHEYDIGQPVPRPSQYKNDLLRKENMPEVPSLNIYHSISSVDSRGSKENFEVYDGNYNSQLSNRQSSQHVWRQKEAHRVAHSDSPITSNPEEIPQKLSARSEARTEEYNLEHFFASWIRSQHSFRQIDDTNLEIEISGALELPWRVPVTLIITEAEKYGYRRHSKVFFVEDIGNEFNAADPNLIDADETDLPLLVLKESSPENLWEFYIYRTIQERLRNRLNETKSIPAAVGFSRGSSKSFLVLKSKGVASMSRVIQVMPNNVIPEAVTMFILVELLKALSALHEIGIIHADVTLDNVLFRRDATIDLGSYNAIGRKGWSACGILLVDYNNSIDAHHEMVGGSGRDAIAQYSGKIGTGFMNRSYQSYASGSWAFNMDCYGAAVCAATMLGADIQDVSSARVPLKHRDVWNTFFSSILKLDALSTPEDTTQLMKNSCTIMEGILESKSNLGFAIDKMYTSIAVSEDMDKEATLTMKSSSSMRS